jgi:hypothetical protein
MANYNRKILGKFSYIIFKDNFHGYSSIYWFKYNLTLYLNIVLF